MEKVSNSAVSLVSTPSEASVSRSYRLIFERIYSAFSFLGSLKNRKIIIGLVFVMAVALVGQRLLRKRSLSAYNGDSPLKDSLRLYQDEISLLAPILKYPKNLVYGTYSKDILHSLECLIISADEKTSYFKQFLGLFERILIEFENKTSIDFSGSQVKEDLQLLIQEINEKIASIEPGKTLKEDEEAYVLPKEWIERVQAILKRASHLSLRDTQIS
jgi:hypothetical protein